ncbi:MAG: tripartite tricarboxylate transporter substrate-binding protein, partial [Burkholderiales bacterium]
FATYAVAVPHVKGGRLRVLAVTTPQRQPLLADLPTVGESLSGFAVSNWNGVFVPAKTSVVVVEKLFVELNKALKASALRERQHAVGIEPAGSASRAEFAGFVRADAERWRKIIQDANVKVE